MAGFIDRIRIFILRTGRSFFSFLLEKKVIRKKNLTWIYKIKDMLSLKLPEEQKQLNLTCHLLNHFEQKLQEINVKPIAAVEKKKHVTILIHEINFKYLSGGYLGIFHFTQLLKSKEYAIRLITTEYNEVDISTWIKEIEKYKGLETFFENIKIENVYYRDKPVEFHKNENIIATSIWTAFLANGIRKKLGQGKFIFLIQEYESLFFPSGSLSALAEESYTFPHYAIFSTEILRQYFKSNSIGVFSNSAGNINSVSFQNSIVTLAPDKNLHNRKTRKLLFYFRPEEHAARNMYETGFIALKQAIEEGYFEKYDWDFFGIGSLLPDNSEIALTKNKSLKIIPKVNLSEYTNLLPDFDIGLSLMLSPHPSLVPIEMCSSGMITLTNMYANKNERALKAISENFICASPTIDSIKESLKIAVTRVENTGERIKNSVVNWPSDWERVFNEDFYSKIQSFL